MEIQPIFITGVGMAKEINSLPLAKEIFKENKDRLSPSSNSKNFKTTMDSYFCEKAITKEYVNTSNIDKLKTVIKQNALVFLEIIGYETSNLELKVPNLWLNEMQSGSTSHVHMHYGYSVSGTYYVEMPPNSGKISFVNTTLINTCPGQFVKAFTPFNSGTWEISPQEGDMLFWKSDLLHSVPPVEFEGIRKSIAFDVLIAPKN